MIRLTLTTSLPLAVLLLCGSLSRIQAADTKITVKDGGSILLHADGLDAGKNWKVSPKELRHLNRDGVLSGVQIAEAGADRCAGDPKCGIDPARHWTIQVNYGAGSVTIASVSANKGLHLKFSKNVPFDQWKGTANADEREFGHGDGHRITGVAVNNGPDLCSGKGCEIILLFSTQ